MQVKLQHLYFNGPSNLCAFNLACDYSLTPFLPIIPSQTSSVDTEVRMLSTQFGDGYEQRAPDGLNAMRLVYNVEFTNLRLIVARHILAFLEGYYGSVADPTKSSLVLLNTNYPRTPDMYFWWTPPPPHDGRSLQFVCRQWRDNTKSVTCSIQAVFSQVYEP